MNVLNAIFDSITDHVLTEHIIDKVRFVRQVGSDLQETLTKVIRDTWFWFTSGFSKSNTIFVSNDCCKKLFVVYIMFGSFTFCMVP